MSQAIPIVNGRNNGKFVKGQSGNPSGRPKALISVREMARGMTEQALDTLSKIMLDEKAKPSERAQAASAILDRAWGKPTQSIENVNPEKTFRDWLDHVAEQEALKQSVS